eukprot:s1757_g8.t1
MFSKHHVAYSRQLTPTPLVFAIQALISASLGAIVFNVTGLRGVWGIGAESLEKAMQMDSQLSVTCAEYFGSSAVLRAVLPGLAILRITWLSGEELTSIPCREVSDVGALKCRLHQLHGLPAFRDGNMLDDAVELDSAMDLQVLTMPPQFSDATEAQLERLYDAAKDGLVEEVEDLLQERLHPDAASDKWNWHGPCTPLMLASSGGRLQVVQLLQKAGAQVELDDSSRFTALMHAAYNGHAQVVQLLLESGSQLEVLLDAGARKDACDIVIGHTALMRASING